MEENKRLSPQARRIARIVAKVGQSRAADILGCTQPHLSRICSGKSEPGKKLVEAGKRVRIGSLQSTGRSTSPRPLTSYVPVSKSLLLGPPHRNRGQLKACTLPVAPILFRTSLYAFEVDAPIERKPEILIGDILLIDAEFLGEEIGHDSVVVYRNGHLGNRNLRIGPFGDVAIHSEFHQRQVVLPGDICSEQKEQLTQQKLANVVGVVVRLIRDLT